MKISNQKLLELQKELKAKRDFLKNELEEGVKRGGPMDSFKEAAAVSANLQAHYQKLKELEDILNDAEVLPDYIDGDEIMLGKWFDIDINTDSKRFRLVESIEADISKHLLSIDSPLGKAVFGKKQGEKINFNEKTITITNVD